MSRESNSWQGNYSPFTIPNHSLSSCIWLPKTMLPLVKTSNSKLPLYDSQEPENCYHCSSLRVTSQTHSSYVIFPFWFRLTTCVCVCLLSHFSCVWHFAALWIVACQAPLSMGILQARILEWVAMPSSRRSSQLKDRTPVSWVSCIGRRLYHERHLGSPMLNTSPSKPSS